MQRSAIALAALLLAACTTVGEDYTPPDPLEIVPAAFTLDADIAPLADAPSQDWWTQFGDPALDGLVEQGLAANRTVREAAANVARARSALGLQRTQERPTGEISGVADYGRPALAGGRAFGPADPEIFFSLGASAQWELDLYGHLDRLTEAAEAELAAQDWTLKDLQAVAVAGIAAAYLDVRSAETGIRLAERNRALQTDTLEITRVRVEEGATAPVDLTLARAQLRATEALIPPFRADRAAAINRLATLTAQSVNEVEAILSQAMTRDIPPAPESLPLGDVRALMQRRADVRSAERTLAALSERAAAARADWFPTVTLLGTTTTAGIDPLDFGGPGSIGFGIGPRLNWGGFDKARVRASIGIADAEADAALARYERTVLEALEETQSGFAAFGRTGEELTLRRASLEESRRAAEIARLRYEEGADDFLSVLDAERRLLEAESAALDARRRLSQSVVTVYRALGAGWR